jgi:hypothetical protein
MPSPSLSSKLGVVVATPWGATSRSTRGVSLVERSGTVPPARGRHLIVSPSLGRATEEHVVWGCAIGLGALFANRTVQQLVLLRRGGSGLVLRHRHFPGSLGPTKFSSGVAGSQGRTLPVVLDVHALAPDTQVLDGANAPRSARLEGRHPLLGLGLGRNRRSVSVAKNTVQAGNYHHSVLPKSIKTTRDREARPWLVDDKPAARTHTYRPMSRGRSAGLSSGVRAPRYRMSGRSVMSPDDEAIRRALNERHLPSGDRSSRGVHTFFFLGGLRIAS